MKPLFENKTFSDLFTDVRPAAEGEPAVVASWPGESGFVKRRRRDRYIIQGWCSLRGKGGEHRPSLSVKPTEELVKSLRESLVVPDRIYFEVILGVDNIARVFAQYNSIIGNRHIADVPPESVPGLLPAVTRKHCPDCGPTTTCPHGYSDLA